MATFSHARTSEYLTVEENCRKLNKFIEDYKAVKSSLTSLSEKCKHPVMVPFGNVAFMSGSLVHTNDVLVLLGDNWFVEQSAKQTSEILDRRIAALHTQVDQLRTRMQQIKTELDYAKELAEGTGDTVEIVEPYDEQFEQSWKAEHDANMRKYRQVMKESKNLDGNISTHAGSSEYERIWHRLEELEEAEEKDDNVEEDRGELPEQETLSDQEDDSNNTQECSLHPLVINFKHSETGSQIRERRPEICSPADIYDRFCLPCVSEVSHFVAEKLDQSWETQVCQSKNVSSETFALQSSSVSTDSQGPHCSLATDKLSCDTEHTVRRVSKFKASRLKK